MAYVGPFLIISPRWNALGDRFEKNDILRIVRALAIFRPSLIALQMPMTDEDEVFVERCFQRSLLVRPVLSCSSGVTHFWRSGTRKADFVQRYADRCMATYWRNLSRRTRILHVD